MEILESDFFDRKTLIVAKDLIGKYLVRKENGKTVAFMVTEVEAYVGPHDLASHSSKGRTPRTEVMFGPPGTIYVYLVYGVHWMLNIVTEKEDFPAAVLIRGVEGISGPGRVTKQLGIDKKFNGLLASKKTGLWFEDRSFKPKAKEILKTARIGVKYAGPIWSAKPYRFVLKLSKK